MDWSLIVTDINQKITRGLDEKFGSKMFCIAIFTKVKKPIDGTNNFIAHITFLPISWS